MAGYNGIFNVTNKNNKLYFTVSINDDDFNQITVRPGAYEIESLNNEIKRDIIEDGCFKETNYPFTIKPSLLTPGYFDEFSSNITGSQIAFTSDDSIKDLLGFKPSIIHEEYNLSDNPVDILSFDNFSLKQNSLKV